MKRNNALLLTGIALLFTGIVMISLARAAAISASGMTMGPYPLHSILYLPKVKAESLPEQSYPYPYPEPTEAPPLAPFEILKLQTLNNRYFPQTTFGPGEIIYLVASYSNNKTEDVVIHWKLTPWDCGDTVDLSRPITLWIGITSTPQMMTEIPKNACAGKYTVRLRVVFEGQTWEEKVEIDIR